jgi:dolichyl-phosphate beta-glucosyltransferase
MAVILEFPLRVLGFVWETAREMSTPVLLLVLLTTALSTFAFVRFLPIPLSLQAILTKTQVYALVFLLAPTPRAPYASEKTYITTTPSGSITSPKPLPCWHDEWLAHRHDAASRKGGGKHTGTIDEAEVEVSVVIPAYNEEERIVIMLEEAISFLDSEYGRNPGGKGKGYEILIVNDGSKDKTVDICLDFAKENKLHDILRVCTLKENRGKGGAVTHGFRHVRGAYTVFADADGASRFGDLRKLVEGCKGVEDGPGRGIAVGSRAHLVGSEAVVKVFSPFLPLLTPLFL